MYLFFKHGCYIADYGFACYKNVIGETIETNILNNSSLEDKILTTSQWLTEISTLLESKGSNVLMESTSGNLRETNETCIPFVTNTEYNTKSSFPMNHENGSASSYITNDAFSETLTTNSASVTVSHTSETTIASKSGYEIESTSISIINSTFETSYKEPNYVHPSNSLVTVRTTKDFLVTHTNSLFSSTETTTAIEATTTNSVMKPTDNMTLEMINTFYCVYKCDRSSTERVTRSSSEQIVVSLYCYYCSCEDQCHLYDMCCPDVAEQFFLPSGNMFSAGNENEIFDSRSGRMKLVCQNWNDTKVMVIASCPRFRDHNETLVDLCERAPSAREITAELVTATIDLDTDVIYKNRFCASCNNASRPVSTDLMISCMNYMSVYTATTLQELLVLAYSAHSKCAIVQNWSGHLQALTCYQGEPPIIGGNGDQHIQVNSGQYQGSVLSFLLNFDQDFYRPDENQEHFLYSNCTSQEWASPDGSCLPVQCTPGKVLRENTTCVTALPQITALYYSLNLWVTAERQSPLWHKLVVEKISSFLEEANCEYQLNISLYQGSRSSEMRLEPFGAEIEGWMQGPIKHPRDSFESILIDNFIGNILVRSDDEVISLESLWSQKQAPNNRGGEYKSVFLESKTISRTFLSEVTEFIAASSLLTCGFVAFNTSQYELSIVETEFRPNIKVVVDLNVTRVTFSDTMDLNALMIDSEGTLKVCQSTLDKKLKELEAAKASGRARGAGILTQALDVLSLVCFGASIVCLLLTVLSYAVHPALRTAAGKNNMMLSLSLLLAQSCLLSAPKLLTTSVLCVPVAATTHFTWLWMFAWTFICSLDMFLVFTAKTRRVARGRESCAFIRRFTLSFIFPALVVSATVAVSYITSGGSALGYGKYHCLLDSQLLTGVTLGGPLCAIVISNTIFFVISVWKIHQVRQLGAVQGDQNKDDHHNFMIYVKLSTMTGAFWILTFVAELTAIVYIQFITLLINGLQGVYIFLSYICNKRVLMMYLRLADVKKPVPVSSLTAMSRLEGK